MNNIQICNLEPSEEESVLTVEPATLEINVNDTVSGKDLGPGQK